MCIINIVDMDVFDEKITICKNSRFKCFIRFFPTFNIFFYFSTKTHTAKQLYYAQVNGRNDFFLQFRRTAKMNVTLHFFLLYAIFWCTYSLNCPKQPYKMLRRRKRQMCTSNNPLVVFSYNVNFSSFLQKKKSAINWHAGRKHVFA